MSTNTYQQCVWCSGKKPRKLKIKKIQNNIIKNGKNLFRLKKENEAIKSRIIRNVKNLFEQEEDYYKPVRIVNFHSNNYIEYKSNGDRNKNLSIKE